MSWVLERGCDHPYALRPGQAVLFAAIDAAIARRVGGGPVVHVAQAPLLDLRFPQDFLTCAGGLMWSDTDHLSGAGRLRFGARLVPLLNPPG
jgi:hypothetical protein